jgi:FAD/FMN-containing dehydrogenase
MATTASKEFRGAKTSFRASQDIPQCDGLEIQHLLRLLEFVPNLKLYTRSSPQFQKLRAVWNLMLKNQPIAICRPTSASQVSKVVGYCENAGISIAVRSGGHDVWGRSVITDALIIDIRDLDEMTLADDMQSLKIGGGVTAHNLLAFLETHGLSTAAGAAGTVGWAGWAIWGGYGLLDDWLGLGLDQIIGAKLVKADGTIVDADGELLWAIRGAGGNLGVIAELTIRVHSMPKILAGFIVYKYDEIEEVIVKYQELLDGGVPAAFCGRIGLSRRRDEITMAIIFLWPCQNFGEGEIWHQKVRDLGTVIFDTVAESMDASPMNLKLC